LGPSDHGDHPLREARRDPTGSALARRASRARQWPPLGASGARYLAGAREGLQFVHDGGSTSGSIQFDPHEPVPHPSEVCDHLQLDGVWLFGNDFNWAVHAGHEDWDVAKLFERAPPA